MNSYDWVMLGVIALSMLTMLVAILNALAFYLNHYKKLSEKIDGKAVDTGFLFSAMRFMHWGHLCLSEKRAKKFGLEATFSELPRIARAQLIFHWGAFMFMGATLLLILVWLEINGEGWILS